MNTPANDSQPSALPGDASPAEAAAEAAKPKRTRRKAAEAAPAEASAAEALPPVAEAEAKPKRTRRKAAEAEAAPQAAAEVVAAPVAVDAPVLAATSPADAAPDTAPAKPARTRRRAPAAEVAGSELATVPVAEPVVAAPVAPAVATPAPASEAAAPRADAAASQPAVAAPVAAVRADDGGDGAEGGDGEGDGDGEGGDGQRRRNRNRRRGRRGGADRADRPPREDGAPGEAFQVVTVSAGDDEEEGATPAEPAAAAEPQDAGATFAAVLTGDFDAEAGEAPPEPEKRVLAPEPDAPKLHKVLAQAGIGSRRDMEQLIADGQVQVNGQVAHTGQRISFGDRISVGGRQIKVRIAPGPARVIAYHKPVGEVVTHDDPQHRPTVFRRLPRLPQGKWQSVGRLDINTEGLLLFTNSGELANQLMHPRFGVEREYAVRVLGTLGAEQRDRLLEGVEIDGQRAAFKSIEDGGGEGVNHWYRVVITEGRNREVRKLFDKVGLGVSRLIRIRYGCVVLPRGLKRGVYVDLNQAEVGALRRLAGNDRGERADRGERSDRGERPDRGAGAPQRPPRQDGAGKGGKTGKGGGQPQGQRAERDRPPRPDRQAGGPGGKPKQRERDRDRAPRDEDDDIDRINFAAIPNPLMQTFDKRAIREARQPRREIPEDGPIPNPLEQTYDKRFVQKQNPFGRKGKGGGGGGQGGQPDPMKTSVGYIGADAFVRKFQNQGGGGGGGGGGNRRGGRRGGGGGR